MKLIESKVEILENKDTYQMVELAGRTCYKPEDKITADSAKEFVDRMIKLGHGAMLEHGTIYLFLDRGILEVGDNDRCRSFVDVAKSKYSRANWVDNGTYITTNLRVLVENNWLDVLRYQCEPTEHHEKRVSVKFTCDRGVSHEFVRHRVFSFAQESTRYCNYGKDKFGNELTFIKPSWWTNDDLQAATMYLNSWKLAEHYYLTLIENGIQPQQARAVLPNALKTELVMTGFESDWEGFFKLRCAGSAHPDARKLANELKELMVK